LYLKDVKGQDIVRIMLCCRQDSEVVMRESYSLAYCSWPVSEITRIVLIGFDLITWSEDQVPRVI
jgi:hypothetical protein